MAFTRSARVADGAFVDIHAARVAEGVAHGTATDVGADGVNTIADNAGVG